jgi:hypothetical protein
MWIHLRRRITTTVPLRGWVPLALELELLQLYLATGMRNLSIRRV